jgi:hypothetical protein
MNVYSNLTSVMLAQTRCHRPQLFHNIWVAVRPFHFATGCAHALTGLWIALRRAHCCSNTWHAQAQKWHRSYVRTWKEIKGGGNPINFKMKFLACFHFLGPLPHIGLLVNAVPALNSLYSSTAISLASIHPPRRSNHSVCLQGLHQYPQNFPVTMQLCIPYNWQKKTAVRFPHMDFIHSLFRYEQPQYSVIICVPVCNAHCQSAEGWIQLDDGTINFPQLTSLWPKLDGLTR